MNEILELLKLALNKMLLKTQEAETLVADCKSLKDKCSAELSNVRIKGNEFDEKISELRGRESRIRKIENLEAEKQAMGERAALLQKREEVVSKSEKEAAGKKAANEDRAKALAERELALSREKESYKEQLKKEFFADVASGKIK